MKYLIYTSICWLFWYKAGASMEWRKRIGILIGKRNLM